ncbi:MAG: type II toxin-antitoxin system death-on-curing family toxin [Alphaproteobacteria bacterium]|nr:type II toxin-antitoxin system death-on-curing family toxin [Alphaproteobacteria bacterium]
MKEPRWLDPRAVRAMHEASLAEYGGASGVRDEGLFDSALARPKNLLAYGNPSVAELAAAYAAGLVKNHPFIDGNKRIGFLAAYVFLRRNGYRLVAPEAEVVETILALAAGRIDEAALAAWIAARIDPA